MTTTIELILHLDAEDRVHWTAVQNVRPLTELGRRQAEALAEALLAAGPVDALYSSPALRCKQSLGPLAERLDLPIQTHPDLTEKWFGEDTARLAERGLCAIDAIRASHPGARVAVCSHGDLVPAVAARLAVERDLPPPPQPVSRGQWYTLRFDGDSVDITLNASAEETPP